MNRLNGVFISFYDVEQYILSLNNKPVKIQNNKEKVNAKTDSTLNKTW